MSYILELSSGYPTEKYPLIGIFELDQTQAIKKAGKDVILAVVDVRSIRRWRKWGIGRHTIKGLEIYEINIPIGGIPIKWRVKIESWALKKLFNIIKKERGNPAVIHAHFGEMGFCAAELKKRTGIPVAITEHFSGINAKEIACDVRAIYQKAYSQADRLIAVSSILSKKIKSEFGYDATVIHNIVDTTVFNYIEDKLTKGEEKSIKVISVGSLEYRKGFDILIKAMSMVKINKKITLEIYGDGSQRDEFQKQIEELNLQEVVKLKGYAPRQQLAEVYKKADFFVLASRCETFGVVYIEALAAGLPVIATECGGPEDFVNRENGILINTDNAIQLAEAIGEIALNLNIYDKNKIAEEARRKFSPQFISSEIITELIEFL